MQMLTSLAKKNWPPQLRRPLIRASVCWLYPYLFTTLPTLPIFMLKSLSDDSIIFLWS